MNTDSWGASLAAVRNVPCGEKSLISCVVCAVLSVSVAVGLRHLLGPVLGTQFPFATIFLAILFTAWYGGLRPAILAVVLGGIGSRIFLSPVPWPLLPSAEMQVGLVLYLSTGLGIAFLAGSMHNARRQAEASAMLISRHAALIEQVHDAVLVWNWDGRIVSWNCAAERLYGCSREVALGSNRHQLLGVSPAITAEILGALSRQAEWEGEFVHSAKGGVLVNVKSRMVVVREDDSLCVVECNRNITARKRAEQELSELNASLQTLVEARTAELRQSHDEVRTAEERSRIILEGVRSHAIIMVDLDGRVATWNPGAERLGGYSAAEAIGSHIGRFYPPEEVAAGKPEFAIETARTQGYFEEECTFLRRDGSPFWAIVSVTLLRSNTGDPVGFVAVVRDISERRRIQVALRASEERFRLLVDGVKDYAILMLDPAGTILTWNRGAENLEGYSSGEMIGHHYSSLFPPEAIALDLPNAELRRAAAEGKAEVEGWRVRSNGTRFWVNGTIAALYEENGSVYGFAKVTRDFTAKRRNDELLTSVLDHTIDGIVATDEHGVISMINRAGEDIFGHTSAQLVGQHVCFLMPEPHDSEPHSYLANYLRTSQANNSGIGREVNGLRRDGTTFPMELAVTEFQLDNQRNFVGIVRDLSERKKLEAQLHQAQKMDAFGQLAGGVAHDFNNLLTVISGYSAMLLADLPLNDPTRVMLEQVARAGDRAASLTRQLLAFSRQQILEPKVLDLNAVIADTEKMLRRLIGEDIEFTTVLDPTISMVKFDQGQIEQVIMNLAVNSRDAMPQGGGLTIETSETQLDEAYQRSHPDAAVGRFVMLAVSDTGCGIPPDVKARIFEPFFSTKGTRGTGLGLAVVHGIVKQSGGNIDVYSEVGIGTMFKIYLPAVPREQEVSAEPATAAATGGSETILLVEDDTGVREFSRAVLESFGYTVITAPEGNSALQLLASHSGRVDLLVTDVVMPEMSGRKLAEILMGKYPGLPVLYLSGYTDDAVVRHGLLHSHVSFLQKPFTPDALGAKVRETLR